MNQYLLILVKTSFTLLRTIFPNSLFCFAFFSFFCVTVKLSSVIIRMLVSAHTELSIVFKTDLGLSVMAESLGMASASSATFKCRRCRHLLFSSNDLSPVHAQVPQCSSWYLKDDDMLLWVQVLVDESGWTEGKLYCPKCNGRVGGFDFLHVVHCSCLVDVIPAIWCPKSRVDIASKFILKSSQEQTVDTEGSCNTDIETGNDSSLKECTNGNTLDDMTDNKYSAVDTAYETEMQNSVIKALRNSGSTCIRTLHETQHPKLSAIGSQNLETMEASICDQCSLASRFVVCKDSSVEVKPMQHCHSCKGYSISTNCCGANVPSCTDNSVDDSYISVRNIQEGLREIRREVENLYPRCNFDENSRSREFTVRRKRKPRRRGRCSWQHGSDYFKYMKEIKETKNPSASQMSAEMSISKQKLHEFGGNCEKEKELSDSEIPDCYKCSVCLSLLHEPLKTPCQHVFCALCIRQLNHVSRGRPKCPLCREPIRDVEAEEDLATEIQVSFPVNYRQRTKETKRNRHRRSALPTPNSTMFDSPSADQNQGNHFRLIHHVTVIALAISLLINSLLVNNRGNPIVRANLQRSVALFFLVVVGCMFASLFLLCLVLFAFDFVKIALLLVLSYVAVIKLALGTILE